MWCQNCGKARAHYHRMGTPNSKYCQRCRQRGTKAHTYCRFCGEERLTKNYSCDVHDRNFSSCENPCHILHLALFITRTNSIYPIANGSENSDNDSDNDSDSPPSYSPPRDLDDDDYGDYATDMSDTRSRSPSPASTLSTLSSTSGRYCSFCETTFDTESEKNDHCSYNNSGCLKHLECFPSRENYKHGKDNFHTQCFVPGCNSKYADDLDWEDKDIMRHVRSAHHWNPSTLRFMSGLPSFLILLSHTMRFEGLNSGWW